MRLANQKRKLTLPFVLLCGCIGCAIHQPISKDSYELTKVDSRYVLISPTLSEIHGNKRTIHLNGDDGRLVQTASFEKACSIRGAWFSIYPKSSCNNMTWVVVTPPLQNWGINDGNVDMKAEWKTFLDKLAALQQKHCFGSANEYLSVKEKLAEGLSIPAEDVLYYRYSFGSDGYVDLVGGMKLRIERGITAMNPHGSSIYRGTIITSYAVRRSADGGTRLRLIQIGNRAKLHVPAYQNDADTILPSQFAGKSQLRLFLLDLAVSENIKTPAILVGGSNIEKIHIATEQILAHPGTACNALRHLNVTCAAFHGLVTVSPLIDVVVNGHSDYIPISSRLGTILPYANEPRQAVILNTLRVQRLFDGKYIDLRFVRSQQGILQLLLCNRDKISWSKINRSN